MATTAMFLIALVASARADRWDALREGVEAWHALQFDDDFAVNVGDESGTLFRWESPGFSSATTRMAGASLSKWPAAIMISGLVNDGIMSYDDLASKHLSWWATDDEDPRSRVTPACPACTPTTHHPETGQYPQESGLHKREHCQEPGADDLAEGPRFPH